MKLNFKNFAVAIFCIFASSNLSIAGSIKSSKTDVLQGETIEITVLPDNNDAQSIDFLGKKYPLFNQKDGSKRCLLPIPVIIKPGKYQIACQSQNLPIVIKNAKFPIQYLNLPKSKDNFITSPGEEEAINKAKNTLSPTRYFTNQFQQPVTARISTQFGLRRVVNGKLLNDYFHSGIDYAANLNTKIKACAPGVVILTGHNYKLHGNTVCIDHGQGVISIYIHMNKIMVKEGQKVNQGDILGLVGQTGRANGPHLHFSIYVDAVATNPNCFYKTKF